MTTELTVVERAAIALGADEGEKQLIALATKYTDITDIKNPAGRTQCHAAAMELGNARINVDKTGKAAREDANAFQKAVIAEVARRVAIIKPEEDRLLAIRDTWDAEREREKEAKAAAEKARVDAIREKIAGMQAIPSMLVGKSSETIAAAIESLEAVEITLDTHQEFAGEGEMAKIAALDKLREMWVAQAAVELAAAEAARQAELDRIERERVAEANRLEAKRLADLAAAMEVEAQLARDRQALADKQAREKREAAEAEQRTANERAAAAMREQQVEHEARMAAERAELARQQAEIAVARAEQERIERERQEAIEAEARRKREAEEAAAHAEAERIAEAERVEAQRIAEAATAEAGRREREAAAEVERAALEAEVARLHALHFAHDGLGMLEDVMNEIVRPIGQECCGRPGSECCGCPEPIFHTIDSLATELNKWRDELIQRRAEQKEAA